MKKIAVIGAGFSGAVIAHELSKAGFSVDVFESRQHVGGNCHTERDSQTNVMVHVYGPHIFHTNNEKVWKYVQQFDDFMPFINRVKAIYNNKVYSLPINLLTINNFFEKVLSPKEASEFIASVADRSIREPLTLEEQALSFIGKDLYEAFIKGYTIKQWGVDPRELPASILKRLPVRFSYDDNYYSSKFQGMPKHGYTYIVSRMLDYPNIKVYLDTKCQSSDLKGYTHTFNSGPIDSWFEYSLGHLGYRTLDFRKECHSGDFQGNAVINYCNLETPWTRISEHKHFSPWETHESTIIYKEYSRLCEENDIPYYPIRLTKEKKLLTEYINLVNRNERNMTFVGRLGTYRYLDMHVTISEALDVVDKFKECQLLNNPMPTFSIDPLA